MDLLQSILYGFFAGLSDILPVSAQAHRMLLISLFGKEAEPVILRLMIHIGTAASLYVGCQNHILRIGRAYRLSKVPKRRRTRPLDQSSLMDLRIVETMLIPVIFGFIYFQKLSSLVTILSVLSWVVFLNGVMLYVPQFLPGSNKNSLSLSPFDGILMGLGATASLIPGISCVGAVTAIATVRGADKTFSLSIALLINLLMTLGLSVVDVMELMRTGAGALSFGVILTYLSAAAAAFGGAYLGIWLMRKLASTRGFGFFSYYCWGVAMFIFILFLSV